MTTNNPRDPEDPIVLDDEAWDAFQDALDRPPRVDERLRETLAQPRSFTLVEDEPA